MPHMLMLFGINSTLCACWSGVTMTRWWFAPCGLQACKTRTRSICWPEVVKGVPDQGLDCSVS